MEFGWINVFGACIVVLMLIPNVIYAIKNKGEEPPKVNKTIIIIENIGRYACMVLMWLPLFMWEFGFKSLPECFLYFALNGVMLILYYVFFGIYIKKKSRLSAVLCAVLPSLIFMLSGILLRHVLLIVFASVFAVSHIFITVKS